LRGKTLKEAGSLTQGKATVDGTRTTKWAIIAFIDSLATSKKGNSKRNCFGRYHGPVDFSFFLRPGNDTYAGNFTGEMFGPILKES